MNDYDLTVIVESAASGAVDSRAALLGSKTWSDYDAMSKNGVREVALPFLFHGSKALADLGYRKPRVLAYVVLDRDGQIIGKQFTNRPAAQAFADEWTADCKTAGIDWDYRVAEIVEVTK